MHPDDHGHRQDLRATFDFMADRYVDQTIRVSRGDYPGWMDDITALVQSWAPESVADVGCGPGYLLERLSRTMDHADLVGVDYSAAMLQHVPEHIPTLHQPLEEWIESSDKTYDVVLLTFVLRDQPNPDAILSQLQKRLTGSGHLLVLETHTPIGWRGWGFHLYFEHWLPFWGQRRLAPDWPGAREQAPYRWLADSHRRWRRAPALPDRMRDAGYGNIERHRPETDVVMLWSATPG
ncbi:methyltransferase domain-containing protein [Sulfobacillus harzensis]|uniref:Methyltransferase domain-containing protein n=1 Tax=Sulfobacillus harzensis TaxID=2729629 RepID=A0A7Y0Q1U0_9FIRM|nr:methyltransferase domain-containing protein [Sulfobacillus harzensis]NMP21196.1 methyltransferase domain-containing protein [Sulfobacillus harzensis]